MLFKAAYFDICQCGKHGRLVFANDETSGEFGSKEKAREALNLNVARGVVSKFEYGEALRQINQSSLAEREGDVGLLTHIALDITRLAEELGEEGEEADEPPHAKYVN